MRPSAARAASAGREPVHILAQDVERAAQQAARGRASSPHDRRLAQFGDVEPIPGDGRAQNLTRLGRKRVVLATEIEQRDPVGRHPIDRVAGRPDQTAAGVELQTEVVGFGDVMARARDALGGEAHVGDDQIAQSGDCAAA